VLREVVMERRRHAAAQAQAGAAPDAVQEGDP
jgi:hypothetical protein